MKTMKLGDLVKITIGRTPSRSDSDYWDTAKTTNNVWLSIADLMHTDGKVVNDSKEYITDVAARSFESVPKDTLLVSFKLTLGRLAFVGRELRTNEAIAALRNDESQVLNEYLYHYLSHFNWEEFAAADQKVKGLTLNKAKLNEIPILFPESLSEQRKVVEKLDRAFEKIDRAEKLMQQNVLNVQMLQKSILQQAFNNTHTHRLGDILTLQRGFDLPKYMRHSGRFPLASSSGIIDTHSEYKVRGPGIFTGRSGSIGNTFYTEEDFWPLNTTLYVKDFHGNDPRYCYWLLKSIDLTQFAGGTGVPTLNRNIVHKFEVSIAGKAEQSGIARRIDQAMGKTTELSNKYRLKLEKMTQLRQSLLQEAFSK